jgi:hypothetical protein
MAPYVWACSVEGNIDPVEGRPRYRQCSVMRSEGSQCGPEGKLWEKAGESLEDKATAKLEQGGDALQKGFELCAGTIDQIAAYIQKNLTSCTVPVELRKVGDDLAKIINDRHHKKHFS